MRQKKLVIIIVIVFILILSGLFFVYQSFVSNDPSGGVFGITTGKEGSTLFPNSNLFNNKEGVDGVIRQSGPIPTLRQISSTPSSGGIVFNTEKDVTIRYIERSTGHIFETTMNSLEQRRISNTTIPRIQRGIWSPNGEMVILQYLDDELLKSFYGNVSGNSGVLEGWFLSNNITNVDVHEDGDIFYMQKIGSGVEGFVSNFDGTNSRGVLSSKISDWIPTWIGDSIGVISKASNSNAGFLYQIQSGNRIKLASRNGLIVNMSPDGTKILFSVDSTSGTTLFIHDLNSEETTEIPFTTLAEKCTWTPDNITLFCAAPYDVEEGIVPDDWYKGIISFSDDIWSYNTETKTPQLVYDAEANETSFDAINLSTNDGQNMILFTDKNTLILWGLTL